MNSPLIEMRIMISTTNLTVDQKILFTKLLETFPRVLLPEGMVASTVDLGKALQQRPNNVYRTLQGLQHRLGTAQIQFERGVIDSRGRFIPESSGVVTPQGRAPLASKAQGYAGNSWYIKIRVNTGDAHVRDPNEPRRAYTPPRDKPQVTAAQLLTYFEQQQNPEETSQSRDFLFKDRETAHLVDVEG
jgi:hypothetical protein